MRRRKVAGSILLLATAGYFTACLTISVTSPDGKSTAKYTGTSIIGGEDVSCGSMGGILSCSGTGQNVAALAQAIAPYVAQLYGLQLPAGAPTAIATSTPAATATPAAATNH
jgi:hypothetical protein